MATNKERISSSLQRSKNTSSTRDSIAVTVRTTCMAVHGCHCDKRLYGTCKSQPEQFFYKCLEPATGTLNT